MCIRDRYQYSSSVPHNNGTYHKQHSQRQQRRPRQQQQQHEKIFMTNTLALYWYTTVYSTSSYHYSIYQCVCVFFYICALFSGARGSFVALPAAGHEGDQPVHHGASLGPGRAPWRVLWAFKDAKSGKYHGAAFRGARAKQCNEKPTYELFCSTAVKAFSFVTATVQQQSYIKFVWTTTNVDICICVSVVRVL